MALTKVRAGGVNLADTFAFTGTVSGAAAMTPAFEATPDDTIANQSLSAGTWTKITHAIELFDSDNMFADSRFTPTVAGKYYCFAGGFAANSNTHFYLAIRKNNLTHFISVHDASQTGAGFVGGIIDFNGSTDYIEHWQYQGTGSGSVQRAYYYNHFGAYRILGV